MLEYLVLAWVSAAPSDPSPAPAAPFHFERADDMWSLVIDGASCSDAKVTVLLRYGMEPYTFEMPYSQLAAGDCSTAAAEKLLAEPTLDFGRYSLPRFPTSEEARDRGMEMLIPEARYRELRSDILTNVFRYPIAPGKLRWVAFPDAKLGTTAEGIPVLDQNTESLRKTSAARFCGKPKLFCFGDETRLAFTSRDATDRIRVLLAGDSCEDAHFLVVVSSADGRELYRRKRPYFRGCDARSVEDAVEGLLNEAGIERTRTLFASNPFLGDGQTDYYQIVVSRETYERIAAADTDVLDFPVGGQYTELFQYVAWDPTAKQAVVVIEHGT